MDKIAKKQKEIQEEVETSPNPVQLEFGDEFLRCVDIILPKEQEIFCQNYVETNCYTDAYMAAFPGNKSSRKTLWETASKYVKRHPQLVKRIAQLQWMFAKRTIANMGEALTNITKIANTATKTEVRLAANKLLLEYYLKAQNQGKEFAITGGDSGAITIKMVDVLRKQDAAPD